MRRVLPGLLLAVSTATAATELTHAELLARIRNKMSDTLARLPNYTCRETIERKLRPAIPGQFETSDLVRLEVAYLGGRELFAWPGSPRFEEKNITEFVPSGSIGTGNFGVFARQVFSSDAPVFTWVGQYARNGQMQVEFRFQVLLEASQFHLLHDGEEAAVAYRGSFTADMDAYDVIDLEVEAQNIPRRLEVFQARERIEYARSRISDSDYLLPTSSETTLYETTGEISRNLVTFHGCHEYRGESTITFTEPVSTPAPNLPAAGPKALPPGVTLHLRTLMPIERGVTAIGDTVAAEIVEPVQKASVPKGATATLRIVRMQPLAIGLKPGYLIGFELLSVDADGQKYDANAVLEGAKGTNTYKWDRKGRVAFHGSPPIRAGLTLTWRTAASN